MATVKKTEKRRKIAVYVERATGAEDNYVRVGVNGKMYQIPRGKTTMVEWPVFEALRRSATAKAVSEAYTRENEYKAPANTVG